MRKNPVKIYPGIIRYTFQFPASMLVGTVEWSLDQVVPFHCHRPDAQVV